MFSSILFGEQPDAPEARAAAPDCFHDLNLDQVVDAIVAGRQDYDLKPFFYTGPVGLALIAYRQAVMRDLERADVYRGIKAFSEEMRRVREHVVAAEKLTYREERQRWLVDGALVYTDALAALEQVLGDAPLKSGGLIAFRTYLTEYRCSPGYGSLLEESRTVRSHLDNVRYALLIESGSVTVQRVDGAPDYTALVEETFARFKRPGAKSYLSNFPASAALNHIEGAILALVAELYPEPFAALDAFCAKHGGSLMDATIARFDREIQFYLACLEHFRVFLRAGLAYCYPEVSDTQKAVAAKQTFDLALARNLVRDNRPVVCNDFELQDPERILVVTGPNSGGKSTFARIFGQLHYLGCLGCPVAAREARLFLFDRLSTHFEREETVATLHGKLEDDLLRMRHILDRASANSIVIINEIFSSTTVDDALDLAGKVFGRLSRLDVLAVCVTFLDELSRFDEKTVSLVAGVAPDDPTVRTFRIEKRRADGLAYAVAVAEKFGLTYRQLKERLKL